MARFQPGQSGNPAGRPRGAGTLGKLRAAIERDAPGIIDRLVKAALSGDTQAAGILLSRIIPPMKATAPPIPGVSIPSLSAAPEAVLSALAKGTLTADQATAISQLVSALARAKEIVELESRIAVLEERHCTEATHR